MTQRLTQSNVSAQTWRWPPMILIQPGSWRCSWIQRVARKQSLVFTINTRAETAEASAVLTPDMKGNEQPRKWLKSQKAAWKGTTYPLLVEEEIKTHLRRCLKTKTTRCRIPLIISSVCRCRLSHSFTPHLFRFEGSLDDKTVPQYKRRTWKMARRRTRSHVIKEWNCAEKPQDVDRKEKERSRWWKRQEESAAERQRKKSSESC